MSKKIPVKRFLQAAFNISIIFISFPSSPLFFPLSSFFYPPPHITSPHLPHTFISFTFTYLPVTSFFSFFNTITASLSPLTSISYPSSFLYLSFFSPSYPSPALPPITSLSSLHLVSPIISLRRQNDSLSFPSITSCTHLPSTPLPFLSLTFLLSSPLTLSPYIFIYTLPLTFQFFFGGSESPFSFFLLLTYLFLLIHI